MVKISDLHPTIQQIVKDGTEGYDLFGTVHLRRIMIDRIVEASFCGTITARKANHICQQVLVEEIQRLDAEIAKFSNQYNQNEHSTFG